MSIETTFSPPRVTANLAHAWGGIWRLTFRQLLTPGHWLVLAIGIAVLILMFAGGSHWGKPGEFLDWEVRFYVTFLVPVLAFMAAGGAMRDATKSSSVDYVLTRPVPRPAFVVFKYLAHMLCAQIDFLFAFAVAVGFSKAHQMPDLGTVLLKLYLGQFLMVMAFSAFGFLCATITSRYIVVGLAYAGVIEMGVGQIPTQISLLSMTHQVRGALGMLLDRATIGQAGAPSIGSATLVLLAFAVVSLVAAAVTFAVRELSGPAEA